MERLRPAVRSEQTAERAVTAPAASGRRAPLPLPRTTSPEVGVMRGRFHAEQIQAAPVRVCAQRRSVAPATGPGERDRTTATQLTSRGAKYTDEPSFAG